MNVSAAARRSASAVPCVGSENWWLWPQTAFLLGSCCGSGAASMSSAAGALVLSKNSVEIHGPSAHVATLPVRWRSPVGPFFGLPLACISFIHLVAAMPSGVLNAAFLPSALIISTPYRFQMPKMYQVIYSCAPAPRGKVLKPRVSPVVTFLTAASHSSCVVGTFSPLSDRIFLLYSIAWQWMSSGMVYCLPWYWVKFQTVGS